MPRGQHLAIAGAGAAGLFCAGVALSLGHRVTLVEPMDAPGKKLAITGKGRCNVTNSCDEATFLKNIRHNPRFLHSAIAAFPPSAAMNWFQNQLGVPLKIERGRRVFPQSDDARDVVEALVRAAKEAEWLRSRVFAILAENGRATGFKLADGRSVLADAVLVATGGLSYPATGSTGDGYTLAKQVGHAIVPAVPSLVAMVEQGGTARQMAGLPLRNVVLRLLEDGREVFREQGEMLFTHFGVSGPLALSASAYLGDMEKHRYQVSIDWKPALSAEQLDARLLRDFDAAAARTAAHSLDKLLPATARPVLLARWGVDAAGRVNQITRAERLALAGLLKDFRLDISARGGLRHAVITAGGVDVKQVNPKTMESKLLPGLYFAGEVLDVDGYTGGYNLHIAWATGHAVAQAQ